MALSKLINSEMARQLVQCGPVLEDNLDLIIVILSYLPVKSLGRFMAVCKAWNAVIRKRYFIEMQLSRSKENPILRVYYASILRPTITRPLSAHSVIASWNGLLFQCSYYAGPEVIQELSIYNPETQQRFYLPKDNDCLFRAEAEPRFGVAYGSRCFDYKVYKFVPPSFLIDSYECDVYSSITGCWKNLGTPPAYPLYNFHVYLNGTVYWQISRGREDYPGSILAVDEVDNFHTFDTPELGSGWPYLIKLGDSLGLAVVYKEVVGISLMSIWVLDNSRTWSKKIETVVPLFPLELTVSAAAWGNQLLITTPRRYLIYHMDKMMWYVYMSTHVNDNERSTFSGFITPSLLPCNGVMEDPLEVPSAA